VILEFKKKQQQQKNKQKEKHTGTEPPDVIYGSSVFRSNHYATSFAFSNW